MENKGQSESQTELKVAGGNSPSAAKSSLLRSSLVVGIMTMLSRVLGLARDVVVDFVRRENLKEIVDYICTTHLHRLR